MLQLCQCSSVYAKPRVFSLLKPHLHIGILMCSEPPRSSQPVLAVFTGTCTAHGLLKSKTYLTSVSMLPSSSNEGLQQYPGYPSTFAADPGTHLWQVGNQRNLGC